MQLRTPYQPREPKDRIINTYIYTRTHRTKPGGENQKGGRSAGRTDGGDQKSNQILSVFFNKQTATTPSSSSLFRKRYLVLDFCRRNSFLSMDPVAPQVSQEAARQSLMAISRTIPDKIVSPNVLPDNSTDASAADVNGLSSAEKYRSKLISISNTQSPDIKPLPATLGNAST